MATEADLWQRETRSEAAYLDLVTPDGQAGFICRVCRFPELELAWTWLHLFHHGHVLSYTHHEIATTAVPVDEAAAAVTYDAANGFALQREGDRFAPEAVQLAAAASMRAGDDCDHGDGTVPAAIAASFSRGLQGVRSLPGRSEILGTTRALVTIDNTEFELTGCGHFHEQVQTRPRFTDPFSYATLRGDGIGLIFARGVRGASGGLIIDGAFHAVTGVDLSAPASLRRFVVHTDGGSFSGEVFATYQYEIPIFHLSRPGSIVSGNIEGQPVSGCLNDLVFGDLGFS